MIRSWVRWFEVIVLLFVVVQRRHFFGSRYSDMKSAGPIAPTP